MCQLLHTLPSVVAPVCIKQPLCRPTALIQNTSLISSVTTLWTLPVFSVLFALDISGSRGRPRIDVSREQLELLLNQGFKAKAMARLLGCSSSFIYRKLSSLGISIRQRFTPIRDSDLEQHVRTLHQQHPRSGCGARGWLVAAGPSIRKSVYLRLETVSSLIYLLFCSAEHTS